jgi:hypothetical protein
MTCRTGLTIMLAFLAVRIPTAHAQVDAKAAAREHFEKGVAAFKEERFADAAVEFETAYRLSPAQVVLYNIGQVDVALGRSVEAVDAFERYLGDGAATISAERRAEVEGEIEKQRAQVGTIAVETDPAGASIRIDARLIGTTPLPNPVRVTAGKHTIEAHLAGYGPQDRDVDVAGTKQVRIAIKLSPVIVNGLPPAPVAPTVRQTPPPVEPVAVSPPLGVATAQPQAPAHSPGWIRVSGYVIGGLGLAAAVTGGVIAVESTNSANDAYNRGVAASKSNPATQADLNSYNQAKTDFDSAKSRNEVGWAITGVGTGALIVGGLMVLLSPVRASTVSLDGIAPLAVTRGGGVALEGSW